MIAEDDEYRCPAGQRRDLPLHHRRARHDAAQVLVLGLPEVPAQSAMHDEQLPAHRALGARGRARRDAGAAGSARPKRCSYAGRPSSIVFGTLKAWMGATHFLTKTLPRVQHGDEPACAGLQPQTRDADRRHRPADASHAGLRPSLRRNKRRNTGCQGHLQSNFRNNLDQFDQRARPRTARQYLSQTLPRELRRRDRTALTFPHGLDPKRPVSFVKSGRSKSRLNYFDATIPGGFHVPFAGRQNRRWRLPSANRDASPGRSGRPARAASWIP